MIISAHELTRTLICAAERCEHDAEPNTHLCYRCAKKDEVKLHVTPEVYTGPTLPCCSCKAYKPDTEFNKQNPPQAAHRRHRNGECKACSAKRRRDHRDHLSPEQREAERARNRATRARNRAARKAQLGWPPS